MIVEAGPEPEPRASWLRMSAVFVTWYMAFGIITGMGLWWLPDDLHRLGDVCSVGSLAVVTYGIVEFAVIPKNRSLTHNGVDLFAGGVPCHPYSKAGKQEGADDDRDLLRPAVEIGIKLDSKCILIENVRGLMD